MNPTQIEQRKTLFKVFPEKNEGGFAGFQLPTSFKAK